MFKKSPPLVAKRRRNNAQLPAVVPTQALVESVNQTALAQADAQGQYDLAIPEPSINKLYAFKGRITRLGILLESMPYWRSFLTVAAISSGISWATMIIVLILINFSKLPAEVPLFFQLENSSWALMNKEVILAMPIIILAATILIQKLNSLTFNFDRRLTQMINLGLITFNIAGIIATAQIFSLMLIY